MGVFTQHALNIFMFYRAESEQPFFKEAVQMNSDWKAMPGGCGKIAEVSVLVPNNEKIHQLCVNIELLAGGNQIHDATLAPDQDIMCIYHTPELHWSGAIMAGQTLFELPLVIASNLKA